MPASGNAKGAAALSICESLLLCLTDLKVLTQEDVAEILHDAAVTHRQAAREGDDEDSNLAAAELITLILEGRNSVRKS